MIRGLGIDVVSVSRIEKAAERPAFRTRIYTQLERDWLEKRQIESWAGAFAAKEAVSKALGTGIAGFRFSDIEITHDERGKPLCTLYNGAKARLEALGGERVFVSIAHEREGVAAAVAVVE